MDAEYEPEVSLQKTAANWVSELQSDIPLLLFKHQPQNAGHSHYAECTLRPVVREDALNRLLGIVSSFQELPQLLDPVLEKLIRPLAEGLILVLPTLQTLHTPKPKAVSSTLAICKFICTLCTVRGPKVIVRFLSNAAKHLEPLVEGLEYRQRCSIEDESQGLAWEERYVFLLWLSHLVLTPFPLQSAGRALHDAATAEFELQLPPELHLVSRTCHIALSRLSYPGKERDAAVKILVHLVLRPDMEEPRLLDKLLDLGQSRLDHCFASSASESAQHKLHQAIGAFALLAGILRAADPKALAPRLQAICRYVLDIAQASSASTNAIPSSAVTRKLIIKSLRCAILAALAISASDSTDLSQYAGLADEILEEVIEQLLNLLSDPDTPVRHAASKALSVVTLKLDPGMGAEVIEAVISSLDEGVLWDSDQESDTGAALGSLSKSCDLSLVNPLRWQGLMLTLAQLLFRKAPSLELLPRIISSLMLGLSFEQRTSTGVSVGGPVRDAANFGLWALARQYTTAELKKVDVSSIHSVATNSQHYTLPQIIACELVCSACLDPFGNIRRGSSAALQELIGRHPDTVIKGISIVQTVEYHAVALRSSAVIRVAVAASRLDETYRAVLLAASLGWRGVASVDADSRRWTAEAIGMLAGVNEDIAAQFLSITHRRIDNLQARDVEVRHGLILSAQQVIESIRSEVYVSNLTTFTSSLRQSIQGFWSLYEGSNSIDTKAFTNPTLRPHLTSEAFFRLLASMFDLSSSVKAMISAPESALITRGAELIEICAGIGEDKAKLEVAKAAASIFNSGMVDMDSETEIINRWSQKSESSIKAGTGKQAAASGWLLILSRIFEMIHAHAQPKLLDVMLFSTSMRAVIEVRVAALEAIDFLLCNVSMGVIEQHIDSKLIEAIRRCLDDYTTDQRGDIASLVRGAALRTASHIPKTWLQAHSEDTWSLLALACGLAGEKLDRVRSIAWPCAMAISQALPNFELSEQNARSFDDFSSTAYFLEVLTVATAHSDRLMVAMFTGLITSIAGGSESVLKCSRQALENLLLSGRDDFGIDLVKALMSVLVTCLNDERLAPHALVTIAYIFETGVLNRRRTSSDVAVTFRELFALVQKAHFKSTNIPRLLAAVDLYTILATFSCVHTSCLKKLIIMLAHPFPLIRGRAAEGLYWITNVSDILEHDWSQPPSALKGPTQQIKDAVLAQP